MRKIRAAIRRWLARRLGLVRPECVWITILKDRQIHQYTTLETLRNQMMPSGVAAIEFRHGVTVTMSEFDL